MTGEFITKKFYHRYFNIFLDDYVIGVSQALTKKLFFRTSPQRLLLDCYVISYIENALVVKYFLLTFLMD